MTRKRYSLDVAGNPLKTVRTRDIRLVDGIWTAHVIDVENHKTGHRTVLEYSDIDYAAGVDDDVFTERALRRGKVACLSQAMPDPLWRASARMAEDQVNLESPRMLTFVSVRYSN